MPSRQDIGGPFRSSSKRRQHHRPYGGQVYEIVAEKYVKSCDKGIFTLWPTLTQGTERGTSTSISTNCSSSCPLFSWSAHERPERRRRWIDGPQPGSSLISTLRPQPSKPTRPPPFALAQSPSCSTSGRTCRLSSPPLEGPLTPTRGPIASTSRARSTPRSKTRSGRERAAWSGSPSTR